MKWLLLFFHETWSILLEMAPFLLLGFLLAGLLSILIRQDLIERWLGPRSPGSVIKASLLGIPLPLCSCGVIPVTSSLYQRGASKGATTSFLTSTPQTGIDSILATVGLLGPLFAVIKVVVALVSGIVAGLLVDAFEKDTNALPNTKAAGVSVKKTTGEEMKDSLAYGFYTLPQDIGKTLVLGILLAGILGAALPDNWGAPFLGNPWLTYLAVTLIAIPLYVCSTGSIPIAFALMAAGVSPGAALVFLIAGPATNVATVTTLLKIFGRRTMTIYLITIIVISWLSGWALDSTGIQLMQEHTAHHHDSGTRSVIEMASGIGLMLMIIWAYIYPKLKSASLPGGMENPSTSTVKIEGMTCSHCSNHVAKALLKLPGVTAARADAVQNLAWVEGGNLDLKLLEEAIEEAGYQFKGLA